MNIKMIVTDLDNTLLRSDKTVSDYTRTILTKCREAGIKVVYATGLGGSAERVVPAGLFGGKISMNGAIGKIDGVIVYNRLIPYQTARPLLVACDGRGIKITSEISGMHYSNFAVTDFWPTLTNFEIVDFSRHELDAEKIYTPDTTPENLAFIENLLPDELYMVVTKDGENTMLAQIMHKEATKSKATAALARHWGISPSEIVAFGDDLNDIDLLEYAGISVAMGNAHNQAKAADYICDTNENDGVAKWLAEKLRARIT